MVFMAAKGDQHQCKIQIATGANQPAQSSYSLDYLKDIAKILVGSSVDIQLDIDHPISLSGTLTPGLSVQYLLAPRIETENTGVWL